MLHSLRVTTSHNVSSGDNNFTVLGLKVNNNILTIENNNPLDGQSLRITEAFKEYDLDAQNSLLGKWSERNEVKDKLQDFCKVFGWMVDV